MSMDQILFLAIMFAAIALFVTEYFRVDVVAMLIIVALSVSGLLDVKSAFSGFSSEPAIIVVAVFVLSGGLFYSGVTDILGGWVSRLAGKQESRAIFFIMAAVAALSAFTHHLMVTAMMLPVVMKICKDNNMASSRLLIPMATAASLGTTMTLIGAPAFLLANNILKRAGEPALGLFSVSKLGGALVLAGIVFCILMKWVLPKRSGPTESDDRFKLSEISTDLVVPKDSKWIGAPIQKLKDECKERFEVLTWLRNHNPVQNQQESVLREGDNLLVKMNADELVSIDEKLGLVLRSVQKFGKEINDETKSLADESQRIFKGVIAPNSEFIGQSLSQIHFYHRFGVIAVGLWRKTGWVHEGLSDIVLQQGDLVVLWGPEARLEKLTKHRGFLMFLPFFGKSKKRTKFSTAMFIMLASIGVAASGLLPAYLAFVCGALAMVLSGCITVEQAYESVEAKIFVMIAGVIPLGMAMENVGVDKLFGQQIVVLTQGWDPIFMLLVLFWASALLTQVLSDAATTVLLAPIAVAFAKGASISPTASVITVTVGAVASFLTPIGHHGNLLILTPGGYSFGDFLKIGLPLTVILSGLTCYLSLMWWA